MPVGLWAGAAAGGAAPAAERRGGEEPRPTPPGIRFFGEEGSGRRAGCTEAKTEVGAERGAGALNRKMRKRGARFDQGATMRRSAG